MSQSARIAIAGGGPTGLMMARLLAGDGHDVEVYEAAGEIGGLCRSRDVDGYAFDLAGGHIMYTRDARVDAFWTELFADDPCHKIKRDTRILHDRDQWVSYPFENGLGELPLEHNLECTEGVIRAALVREGKPAPDDFGGWIDWKMGSGVAKHFMVPYNEKVWKADLSEMSTEWIADRVPDAPLEDVLRSSLGETTEGYTHQIDFRYPMRGGFAAIHERIAAPVADRVRLHHRVEQIERAGDQWIVDGERFDHVDLHAAAAHPAAHPQGARCGHRPGRLRPALPRRGLLPVRHRVRVGAPLLLGLPAPREAGADQPHHLPEQLQPEQRARRQGLDPGRGHLPPRRPAGHQRSWPGRTGQDARRRRIARRRSGDRHRRTPRT